MLVDPGMLNALKELRTPGQPDPLAEILAVFEADGRDVLRRLRDAADLGEVSEVAALSHRLKGSSANLGATGMQAVLDGLETQARAGILDASMLAAIAGLPAMFRETVTALGELART